MHEFHPQTFELRLPDLKSEVQTYIAKFKKNLFVIYAKYEVKNRIELAAKVREGKVDTKDSDRVIELLKVINECGRQDKIMGREPAKPDEVRLKDIITFSKLPSEASFKDKVDGYKFDRIWDEYREGRGMDDFSLSDEDLQSIGFDDPQKRQELLQEIANGRESNEAEPLAKVFDINEAIAKKKQEDPKHPNWLTTKEVFEAIDEAGYRPATIEELLVFGKQLWKPDVDSEKLTDEEKHLQRVNASYISALGSPFTDSGGDCYVPRLGWVGDERDLDGVGLGSGWRGGSRFLVFRKLSS